MIKAIVIDDEPHCSEVLQILLHRYCPEVEVIDICHSAEKALDSIARLKPQLVFLDIEMPRMNGFEMLEKIRGIDFELIFTTSYNQYAIKAIRFCALDYLLKPIDREELQAAVNRVRQKLAHPLSQQLELLLQRINQGTSSVQRIALPTMEGLQLVPVHSIISCASSSNYTIFYLKGKEKLTVSRTLKEMEELLEDYAFLRVHHSFLVNLNEISRYVRGEGGYLVMSDGSSVDVSRSKKENLLRRIQQAKI